jgi:hypothetical protein
MSSATRIAVSVVTSLLLASSAAVGGGAPKQTDVDACNQEAAMPGSGPSGGQGSPQNRPLDSTTGQPGMKKDMHPTSPTSDLLKGMAPLGQTDPAYRASYLECLKKRGYTS